MDYFDTIVAKNLSYKIESWQQNIINGNVCN